MLYKNTTTQLMIFTLNNGTEEGQEVTIGPVGQADLPAENMYIKGLVGLGQLEAVQTTIETTTTNPSKSAK